MQCIRLNTQLKMHTTLVKVTTEYYNKSSLILNGSPEKPDSFFTANYDTNLYLTSITIFDSIKHEQRI